MRRKAIPWRRRWWVAAALCLLLVLAVAPGAATAESGVAATPTPYPYNPAIPPGDVAFSGVIESVPESPDLTGDWTIAGYTVHVTDSTELVRAEDATGAGLVGQWAMLSGPWDTDSTTALTARWLRIKAPVARLIGPVAAMPEEGIGVWTIAGQSVVVTEETRFAGRAQQIEVGDWVDVSAVEVEGALTAQRIVAVGPQASSERAYGPLRDLARRRVRVTGAIEQVDNTAWKLSAMTVQVSPATFIFGPQRAKLIAEVVGDMDAEGRLVAESIVALWEQGSADRGRIVRTSGVVESVPAEGRLGVWTIAGREFKVTAHTHFLEDKGTAEVGARVTVVGWQMPGADAQPPEALLIAVVAPAGNHTSPAVDFTGVVQSRPADEIGLWKIGGKYVAVIPGTEIDETAGEAVQGATVQVKGNRIAGLVVADQIIVIEPAR